MFLSPVKEKLSVPYPELFSLLERSDGILYDKVVDESSLISHEHPVYRFSYKKEWILKKFRHG